MAQWLDRMTKIALIGVMASSLFSCGGDVRNDPWLQAKLKEIDNQQRKLSDLPVAVSEMREEILAISDMVDTLRTARTAATPEGLKKQLDDVTQRLVAVEKRLATLQTTVNGLGKKVAAAAARTPTSLRTTPPRPTPPKPTPGGARPTPAVKPTPPKPTPEPPKPTPAQPGGFYYRAVKGDTAESVAKKFNCPIEDLLKANTYLKPDSLLHPGQTYWVPRPPK
jgi:LysM repeat protein